MDPNLGRRSVATPLLPHDSFASFRVAAHPIVQDIVVDEAQEWTSMDGKRSLRHSATT
jgi:hypothetical protein